MRTRTLAILAVLGLAVSLLAGLVPSASAHTKRWGTRTSFGMTLSGGEAALGFITSRKKACVDKRKVKLFMVRRGKDKLVGTDRRSGRPRHDGPGYWKIPTNLRPGKKYYAVVTRKNIGKRGHRHVCRSVKTGAYRWTE